MSTYTGIAFIINEKVFKDICKDSALKGDPFIRAHDGNDSVIIIWAKQPETREVSPDQLYYGHSIAINGAVADDEYAHWAEQVTHSLSRMVDLEIAKSIIYSSDSLSMVDVYPI